MLLSSTNKNEKVVLGLLSLSINKDENLTASDLLAEYRETEGMTLYLYKDPATDNFVGLVGVEHRPLTHEAGEGPDQDERILINRMSVIPSFPVDQVTYEMYKDLKQQYPQAQIAGAIQYQMQDPVADLAAKYRQEQVV
ncbi:hypothetical protein ACWODI_02545 [Facklamia languida]